MRFIFISPLFAFHLSDFPLGTHRFCVAPEIKYDPLHIVCVICVSYAGRAMRQAASVVPSAFRHRLIIFPSWTGGRATFGTLGETFHMRFETKTKSYYLRFTMSHSNAFQCHMRFLIAIFTFHLRFTARVRFSETKRFVSRNGMIR